MEVSKPTKQGGGRRKIEMKKVEEGSKRSVTFTKRRKGLFNKACELSELSGAKIAVLVISEKDKPYSCGDVDAIFDQYLNGKVSDAGSESSKTSLEEELIRKDSNETLLKQDEDEKKQREEKTAPEKTGFWWEKDVDETMVEWMEMYGASLEKLKKNVERKLEEMWREKAKASTSSAADHQAVIGTIDQVHRNWIVNGDQASTSSAADHQAVIGTIDQVHRNEIVNGDQCRVDEFFNFDGFGFNGGLL
ncbi:hypothetical protein Ddye_020061 [Dipteronia dyeriana]|uniref:MADS-box domain-containing protein n=1 Tax=Dipteronia dyeriana TaxID=168575 RepID=A0AAD9WVN5_9ROSI|nr:hypothetical protein Ddye_020061 [Dipteronia dyeriana]